MGLGPKPRAALPQECCLSPDPRWGSAQTPFRRGSGGGSPQRGIVGGAPSYALAAKPLGGLGAEPLAMVR